MLQLRNQTPLPAMLALLPDRDGVETVFAVFKGTFTIGDPPTLAEVQAPIAVADQHYGDPAASSIRTPSDICLGKPGTDVVVVGSAWAPGGRPAWQVDASITVGPIARTVRVFGDRVWRAGPAGAAVAWVAPFERMPIVWERAFGGSDTGDRGAEADSRNPVGVGFRARGSAKPLDGAPLPNVEDPNRLISSWRDAPSPAGLAPVAPHWEPRKSFAGTYDDTWQQNRAPYLPADFDARFFHFAPAGLATSGFLQGGELVEMHGLTPSAVVRFTLPATRPNVMYRLDAGEHNVPAILDAVILEPDAGRVALVWRAALHCDKRARRVREVAATLAQTS